jgi:pimeloyl-ACP methyl ester carboxylesterase
MTSSVRRTDHLEAAMSAVRRIDRLWSVTTAALLALPLALTACAAEEATPDGPSPSLSASATVQALSGRFEVESGRSLALSCVGEGSPTVVYDAGTGTGGIGTLVGAAAVTSLSSATRVCSYDRAGTGSSDPAPDRARTVDDLVEDLHALLQAAEIEGPFLLVGSSGGGFDIYHYAGRYPDEVAGLVMDDVPAPQADIPATEVPAWDSADNPEHMDYVLFEHQLAAERLPIPAVPVTVLWATSGQSATEAEQALWLEGSSDPVSVAVQSGHDIMHHNPTAVADAISSMLSGLAG